MKTLSISICQDLLKTFVAFTFLCTLGIASNPLQAQTIERTITGIVKSLDGPVPFAAVVLKGTTIGITSDENGAFTFPQKLKPNDVLVVSSMAYDAHEIVITENSSFIEPFLEANPIVIIASLRTGPCKVSVPQYD